MSIIRINEFAAKDGKTDALRAQLGAILPLISGSPGCRSVRLLQDRGQPSRFLVIETWDSIDAHQAATRTIPPEALAATMPLLAGPPSGAYYRE